MAVVLGNYEKSKSILNLNEKINRETKLNKIKELVAMLEPQIQTCQDIYDTYYHIQGIDEEFAKKLWRLLCRNKVGKIDINSYFSWGIGIGGYVHLSKYGVCIMHQTINGDFQASYELTDKEIYRGKVLLMTYLEDFEPIGNELDIFIRELESFITHFDNYAKAFFDSVSNYKVNPLLTL